MNPVLIEFWSVLLPFSNRRVENEDQVADDQSVASASSGWNRHLPDCAHSHNAMMARSEQIDPAAREILNMSVHAEIAALFRSTNKFTEQQSLQTDEGM
jgi:hypothetical protein